MFECGIFLEGHNVCLKFGNFESELSDGKLLAFDCCGLYVNGRIFGYGGIGEIIEGINQVSGSIYSCCCMDPKDRMLAGCHVVHFLMVGEFLGPKGFPRVPGFLGNGTSFPLLVCVIEHACGDGILTPVWTIVFVLMGIFALVAKDWYCSCFLI